MLTTPTLSDYAELTTPFQWRLRREPNQKGVNGKPPGKDEVGADQPSTTVAEENSAPEPPVPTSETLEEQQDVPVTADEAVPSFEEEPSESLAEQVQDLDINEAAAQDIPSTADDEEETTEEDESDGDGEWISSFTALLVQSWRLTFHFTAPSNIKKYQARENAHTEQQPGQRILQAALITGDMAMRNVALRINLK